MITKQDIIAAAHQNGFADVGFTTAEPFGSHREFLEARREEYGWAEAAGLALLSGTDPRTILPQARTIIVLMEVYFRNAYPRVMEGHFGRCYLDDDRVTRDGLSRRIKAFRDFLRNNGIESKVPFNLPHRMAAARAGMGTFGKNCLFYSGRVARQSSWVLPIAVVIDREFEADESTVQMGCPDWCRNACIAACPTKALKGNGTIDPRKCISYLSYFGDGLTPRELREPMGTYVYGCDRCQNVCPRNAGWLAADLPMNTKVLEKQADFDLVKLLHMDKAYFETRIWPHMFYMSAEDLWRWKMNAARAMGNTRDPMFVSPLKQVFETEADERVLAMAAWALGRIGGREARYALLALGAGRTGPVQEEITVAIDQA
ncbi:MAG: epoxyqueuosine reductase [Thermodesulfobacteriota bacterium]